MARHHRPFWEARVAEVEAGESVEDVARRHRVRPITLRWWRSEIRREQRASPRLLPVVVRSTATLVPTPSLEIAVTGAVVRVPLATDVEYVGALVRAIVRSC